MDAKKKSAADRHKPARMVRIRPRLAEKLDKVVEERVTDFTEEVNTAVREYLQRLGKLPPPG